MKILIVEDDDISLALTRNVLVDDGHAVETASNGQEALEILRRDPCRIVISDWEMPEMNGIQLCEAIRHAGFESYIYIILLTSRDRTEDIVIGLDAGADDFMTKPFEPAELKVRIRAASRVLSLETRDLAIFAMAKLAESRDSDTGLHLERVRSYARALAIDLGRQPAFSEIVDEEFINMIYQTSPLHDIGKIGIPDSVLLKPGRLTDVEFDIMKEHTSIGASALDAAIEQYASVGFLRMARDIVVSHHERWDGGGYPNGLKGEEIPLAGRIVSVADVYDALRSKRVYKDAFSHHIAQNIIVENRGTQFDPDIVDAFERCEEQFVDINLRFAEAGLVAQ